MKVGETIDEKYELVRLLGRGGMGSVFEARHVELGRRVALKFLNPDTAGSPEHVNRFIWEAKTAAAIGSEHIVEVQDVGRLPDGAPYIAMEYLEGEILSELIKRVGPMEPEDAVGVMLQVCEALGPAHGRGIVHRDLKPGNVFLTYRAGHTMWVKILDFGIAKVQEALRGDIPRLTQTGATLGTPYFMAPEQFRGSKDVDQRADVYSAGVLLYTLVTGKLPFDARCYEDLIIQIATEPPVPPSLHVPSLRRDFEAVVLQAMARDRDLRYPSMEALAEALRPFASSTESLLRTPNTIGSVAANEELPTQVTPSTRTMPETVTTPSEWENQSEKSSRLWIGLGAAALIGLVAGIVVVGLILSADRDESFGEQTSPTLPPSSEESPSPLTTPTKEPENRWVRIEEARPGTVLGLPTSEVDEDVKGFRPERAIVAPTYSYEIQQHEVTWGELRPWLAANPDHQVEPPEWLPEGPTDRYAATGVLWTTARAYCQSLGATLPTEEQWEFAARGAGLRLYPWGSQTLDLVRTHAFRPGRPLSPVMTNDQDATPGEANRAIYDLLGNAQEWTSSLFRMDAPVSPEVEAWVQSGGRSYRAVRGFPPDDAPPESIPRCGACYRSAICTGECTADAEQVRQYRELIQFVGFRCARRAEQ